MPASYAASLKTTRMAAVIAAVDANASVATLEICTAAYAAVIVAIPLSKPSFSVTADAINMLGVPKNAAATLAGTNTAAVARIKEGGGGTVINGLTVGVGSGDIQLNSVNITLGQMISVTAGVITHSA